MKKIIISFIAFFFSICIIVPNSSLAAEDGVTAEDAWDYAEDAWNYADSNRYMIEELQESNNGSGEKLDKIQESVDNIDVKQEVSDALDEKTKNDSGQTTFFGEFSNQMIDTVNGYWAKIGDSMKSFQVDENGNPISDNTFLGFKMNPASYMNGSVYNIFRMLGYSLILVFFSISLIENTIKYEIFTLKGGVIIFGRLAVSKIIIDMSGKICIGIMNICTKYAVSIIDKGKQSYEISNPNIADMITPNTNWVIGAILDFIMFIVVLIIMAIIVVPILIASISVILKLITRSIELTMLIIVSPAFFACFSSDTTKQYFRNFILTFIQCSAQLLFMAVVYYIGTEWLTSSSTVTTYSDAWEWFGKQLPSAILIFALSRMMSKPPSVLTNLLK